MEGTAKRHRLLCSIRLTIAILVLICTCLQYSQKIDLSVNIICMVNHTALQPSSPGSHNSTTRSPTGTIFPSVSQIWTKWAPKQDRSFLIGIAVSGSHLGSVFTLPLAGFLCKSSLGWSMLFYTIGVLTLAWVAVWAFTYSNSPATQTCISAEEKQYISQNTRKAVDTIRVEKKQIPWRAIFTSIPCWSQFICHTFLNWGFYTLLTCTPMYMSEVLHFDIQSNGNLSAIPYMLIWLTTTGSSFLADRIIASGTLSRNSVRKIANLIGSLIPACSLIGLCFVTDLDGYMAVAFLALGMAAFGVSFGAGFLCVCNDMTQNYASVVFGISNTLGTLPGIISPYITSLITKNQTAQEWRVVFVLAAIFWLIGGVQYVFLGSTEPLAFDTPTTEEAKKLQGREMGAKDSIQ